MAETPGVSASHSPTAHQGSGPSRKAAAVFSPAPPSGHALPVPGQGLQNRHCRCACPHPASGCMLPAGGRSCCCQCSGW
ncbi:putative outer membrane protein (plasmid) [Salmonella enterica subsp. enterica serovar Bovismorbificans str. 3114]|nr:putative outer membrane protein [Salmonella enterica subsp. enterica serovar Bovismorbificans str. 3114]